MLNGFRCSSLVAGVLAALISATSTFAGLGNFLDQSFGVGGRVRTASDFDAAGIAVAIGTDGKIVMVGNGGGGFAVARYNSDGTLDTSFGPTGIVTFPGGSLTFLWGRMVAIQADGRIVVVSWQIGGSSDPVMVRFNVDGTLDTSFGGTGVVTMSIGGEEIRCQDIAIQSDGKIVATAGSPYSLSGDSALLRYNGDGTPDTSFAGTGAILNAMTGGTLALQGDGEIVVAGVVNDGGVNKFAVARYAADGTPDPSFGSGGLVSTLVGSAPGSEFGARAVALTPDGKIVAAGATDDSGFNDGNIATVRYHADGTLDTSFGGTGIVTSALGYGLSAWYSVVAQPDGKIVAVGIAFPSYPWAESKLGYAVVRYNEDGTPDTSFGDAGTVLLEIGPGTDRAQSSALQSDGKLVVAGSSDLYEAEDGSQFSMARFDLVTVCPATAALSCAGPWGKSSLVMDERKPWREKLSIKLSKGPMLAQNDLGNPLLPGGTQFTMCIYDGAGTLIAELGLHRPGASCRGKACWRTQGPTGYRYADTEAAADGIKSMSLVGGTAGKSTIAIKALNLAAKGRVGLPHLIAHRLAGSSSATLQIFRNDSPQCFSASLTTVRSNTSSLFEATN